MNATLSLSPDSSVRLAEQTFRLLWAWSPPALWIRFWEAQMKAAASLAPKAAPAALPPAPPMTPAVLMEAVLDEAAAPLEAPAPAALMTEAAVSEMMAAEEPKAEDIAPMEATPETPSLEILAGGDDLTMIDGVGPATARRLRDKGLTRFGEVAALSAEQIIELRRSGRLTLSPEQAEAIRASAAALAQGA